MSNVIKPLNNQNNNVVFSTTTVDNSLTVMINPDTNFDGKKVIGSATVLKLYTSDIASSQNSSVSLEGILNAIKQQNPDVKSVVMTITSENFQGSGQFIWNITVDGNQAIQEDYSLDSWSARMDSFIVNI